MIALKTVWIVVRRVNGHFESIGPAIGPYDAFSDAVIAAEELSRKHTGEKYAVFGLSSQSSYEPNVWSQQTKLYIEWQGS